MEKLNEGIDWWLDKLEEFSFERYDTFQMEWSIGSYLGMQERTNTTWFLKGQTLLGMQFYNVPYTGSALSFIYTVRILNTNLIIKRRLNDWILEDDLKFIEATAHIELLPLCINLDWAKDIVSYYLTMPATTTAHLPILAPQS